MLKAICVARRAEQTPVALVDMKAQRAFGAFAECPLVVSFEHQDGESTALTVSIRDNSA
jgi:hypothetical protein